MSHTSRFVAASRDNVKMSADDSETTQQVDHLDGMPRDRHYHGDDGQNGCDRERM
jgi:hypothetical protein